MAPPDDIPGPLQAGIDKLSAPLKTLLMGKVVPYIIQHRLGEDNYVTIEDLADRWDTPQSARTNGPAELRFRNGDNGFDAKKSAYASMKLYQVVRAAKDLLQGAPNSPSASGTMTGRGLPLTEVLCERAQLEKEYMTKWKTSKPQYRDQGSEALLKRQYRLCSKGEIGYIQAKHIISALPEEGERPVKTRRKVTVDGWDKEEEEERAHPTTRRQLERLHLVFRNTLLMCMAAFPQFPQFDLTKEDMDSFYDWFYGPTVAGRRPPPSDQTLLYAERNAWREMHELMHSGLTLKQAMTKVKEDSLFWMREVYERVIQQHAKGKEKGPGKSKKGKWGPPIRQPYWEKPSGKGKSKDKGKGKGAKSKSSDWPSHWAFKNPKGVPFCRDYHLKNQCQGQCGRSHNCPVMNSQGWVCNASFKDHSPDKCPNRA